MSESTNTGTFLKKDSKIVGYMVYPRFLTGLALSETAKLIYVLLLDRARLSISNGGWPMRRERSTFFIHSKALPLTAAGANEL